ncbi:hypothetical protein KO566_07045 [Flavobacteriaceae bacterium XHP0103]|uniref:hypothetical protein n=1 Tax=Marixanthotalea marina TaxID=2844359 RepID=UPI002989CD5F|nr:hypothetical protein [Marixanthotalea marina]MBU3821812.1 hypothetical protein [Marixanthotalea marina]
MKFKYLVRLTFIMVITVCLLISCNYILENNTAKNRLSKESINRIQTNKEEARLLVKAAKMNLDILELCENIQNTNSDSNIIDLAESLEKTHLEISKNYNTVAMEKLISVPTYASEYIPTKNSATDETFTKSTLKLILNKINNQLKLLDTLANISNKTEYKVLTIRDSFKLNSSKNKIENILSELDKST